MSGQVAQTRCGRVAEFVKSPRAEKALGGTLLLASGTSLAVAVLKGAAVSTAFGGVLGLIAFLGLTTVIGLALLIHGFNRANVLKNKVVVPIKQPAAPTPPKAPVFEPAKSDGDQTLPETFVGVKEEEFLREEGNLKAENVVHSAPSLQQEEQQAVSVSEAFVGVKKEEFVGGDGNLKAENIAQSAPSLQQDERQAVSVSEAFVSFKEEEFVGGDGNLKAENIAQSAPSLQQDEQQAVSAPASQHAKMEVVIEKREEVFEPVPPSDSTASLVGDAVQSAKREEIEVTTTKGSFEEEGLDNLSPQEPCVDKGSTDNQVEVIDHSKKQLAEVPQGSSSVTSKILKFAIPGILFAGAILRLAGKIYTLSLEDGNKDKGYASLAGLAISQDIEWIGSYISYFYNTGANGQQFQGVPPIEQIIKTPFNKTQIMNEIIAEALKPLSELQKDAMQAFLLVVKRNQDLDDWRQQYYYGRNSR